METAAVNARRQFTASEDGVASPNLVWGVNGIPGGDATVGTISAEGEYTAPAKVPVPATVAVTVTDRDDPTISASASVNIVPRRSAVVMAGVSVSFAAGPRTVDKNLVASVTVGFASPPSPTFLETSAVSVSYQPVVTAVSPAAASRGASDLSVTISGAGFSEATSLSFLLKNATDSDITVTNLASNADGTQVTAVISIAASALIGPRVVQVVTPSGISTAAGTGGDLFSVQ